MLEKSGRSLTSLEETSNIIYRLKRRAAKDQEARLV
jgi:hypothetical protein